MSFKTFLFAGPSAIGKTYIADQLMKLYPGKFEQAKLYTTRVPRAGEVATDRIFVSSEEFEAKTQAGSFIVHDEFGGNLYGFDHSSLYPVQKHLLVNAWPWLVPQFSELKHTVIVGMQAPENWQTMLVLRMKQRGDSTGTTKKRLKLIVKDVADLEAHKDIIKRHGRFFVIENDRTIPDEILPWIKNLL